MSVPYVTEPNTMIARALVTVGAYMVFYGVVNSGHAGAGRIDIRVLRVDVQWYVNPVVMTALLALIFAALVDYVFTAQG